jgi:hypothetical protein
LGHREVVGQHPLKAAEAAHRFQGIAAHRVEHAVDGERLAQGGVGDVGEQAVAVHEVRDERRPDVGEVEVVGQTERQPHALLIKVGEALFEAAIG